MDKRHSNKIMAFLVMGTLMAMTSLSSCDGYDLGDEDPSWLGSSIYAYLDDGNYTNTVRLIDDLGYATVLNTTGSKTLFVADDDAFNRFYSKNNWGVHRYEDLSVAQKKMLLYGAMINNSCQMAYLSSSTGPTEGDCMRRLTSQSIYDSVPLLTPDKMPATPYWQYYRDNNKTIPCLMDASTAPMIHFIEMFLENKLITNKDCDFLFNYVSERQPGDANVNGVMMAEPNIKCSNGFVHRMAEVMTPLPNMAEIINTNASTQKYAKLLDRFCAPYYSRTATEEYNRLYGTSYDSVFQKRYFSLRSQGGQPLDLTPAESPVNGSLKFDPGWNEFYSTTNAGTSTEVALQENMAVMLVPSDAALDRYWNDGAGKVLKDYYGSWENVPDNVVSKMLNVNMLNSFVNSVPSKFETVLNDANDELGISTDDIDSVLLGCNGAIYLTNKVFNPVAYISVSFPALINETMSVLNWGIERLGFEVYLNSQQSYYSLFIPNNNSLLDYVDPCSFGKTSTQLFRFSYDPNAPTVEKRVRASIWNYDVETHTVGDSIGEASTEQITNRLEDILNQHIVIGDVENGNTYYKTKGGGYLKVENASAGTSGMTVSGGWQIEQNHPVRVVTIYDESLEGNGKTYIIDDEPLMTSRKSVYDILSEHEEFSEFTALLMGSNLLEEKRVIGTDAHGCPSTNVALFNTFNYSVFVPTNEAIQKAHENGLPTWEDVEKEDDPEIADSLRNEITLFLRYHFQDNAVFIGGGDISDIYETSAYTISDDNLSYFKVTTKADDKTLTVTDNTGATVNVVTTGGLYNLLAREYQYDSGDAVRANNLYTSSFAVVHQIDGVLNYK